MVKNGAFSVVSRVNKSNVVQRGLYSYRRERVITVVKTRRSRVSPVQTTLNHILICFVPQYKRQRKWFFKARAEKDIARHIDASSVVWSFFHNCKLANQIARLVAILVKFIIDSGEGLVLFLISFCPTL